MMRITQQQKKVGIEGSGYQCHFLAELQGPHLTLVCRLKRVGYQPHYPKPVLTSPLALEGIVNLESIVISEYPQDGE